VYICVAQSEGERTSERIKTRTKLMQREKRKYKSGYNNLEIT